MTEFKIEQKIQGIPIIIAIIVVSGGFTQDRDPAVLVKLHYKCLCTHEGFII